MDSERQQIMIVALVALVAIVAMAVFVGRGSVASVPFVGDTSSSLTQLVELDGPPADNFAGAATGCVRGKLTPTGTTLECSYMHCSETLYYWCADGSRGYMPYAQ